MQTMKRKLAQFNSFKIITPSKWMADMVMTSCLTKLPPQVIPNAVNTKAYTPFDKMEVRIQLGIPLDRFVILIIATYLEDYRKGNKYAIEAISKISALKPFLLLVGNINDSVKYIFSDFDYKATGYIRDDQEKSAYFSSADVFLFCSLADNMPLVVLETMATGTPTVGFATGGVPEMIEHNIDGFIVPPRDIDGLVSGLRLVHNRDVSEKWGRNAIRKVVNFYNYNILYENHLTLYEKQIEKSRLI